MTALITPPPQNATTASTSDSSTGPSIRHDTANAAALSLSESLHEQHLEKTIPEEEQVTNIDEILGPQATTLEDSSDDSAPTTPNLSDTDLRRPEGEGKEEKEKEGGEGGAKESQSTSHSETTDSELSSLQSPPPSATESVQMVIEESVENSVNTHGKLEVVTSVTISVTADDDDDGNDKGGEENLENGAKVENGEKESGGDSTKETSEAEKEEVSRKDSQVLTEVIIPQEEDVNSFSVTVTNMGDSDATSSSDEDDDKEEEGKKRKDTEEVVSKPVLNGVEEEEGEASGATALPPSITVDEVEKVVSRTSSGSSSDSSKLVPVDSEKRRGTVLTSHEYYDCVDAMEYTVQNIIFFGGGGGGGAPLSHSSGCSLTAVDGKLFLQDMLSCPEPLYMYSRGFSCGTKSKSTGEAVMCLFSAAGSASIWEGSGGCMCLLPALWAVCLYMCMGWFVFNMCANIRDVNGGKLPVYAYTPVLSCRVKLELIKSFPPLPLPLPLLPPPSSSLPPSLLLPPTCSFYPIH